MSKNEFDSSGNFYAYIEEAQSAKWCRASLPKFFSTDEKDDHTHCIICWDALNARFLEEAFVSSIGWLCNNCHQKYIIEKRNRSS